MQILKKMITNMNMHQQKTAFTTFLLLFALMTLSGCNDEITMNDLETRHGVTYVKGGRVPFSGMVKAYYDTDSEDKENRKVFREGVYVEGYKSEKWITYKWDGGRIETPYKFGRKEGIEKTFFSDGNPKQEQRFFDNKPNGNDIYFNRQREITLTIFYRNGAPGAPPPNRKAEIKLEEEEALAAEKRNERLFGKRQKSWIEHAMDVL
jgi:antitoxin component YwqK of YwqJK toxin-antitoxin module